MRRRSGYYNLILAAVVMAGALRLLKLEQKALWSDELASLQRAELPLAAHLAALRGNHPLYELLLRWWIPICGGAMPVNPARSDRLVRVPSGIFGVATVLIVWLTAKEMLSRGGATMCLWLFALSPLHVMFSRIGRPYSLAVMLVAASNWALWRAHNRGGVLAYIAYVLTTTLYLYANLVACAVWAAQNAFMLIMARNERKKLIIWLASNAVIFLLFLPWMIYSFPGAAQFGAEAKYTPYQLGFLAKLLYLPFTLCLGETVHPLNMKLVPVAFVGFGGAFIAGVWHLWRRRDALALMLGGQLMAVFGVGLLFAAAAPKHVSVALPAFMTILAGGLERLISQDGPPIRIRLLRMGVGGTLFALMLSASVGSLGNYFLGREFHDADMVTPWQDIVRHVERGEAPGDALLIGYQADRGIYDMFRRYYLGRLQPTYLDFSRWDLSLENALREHARVWLLLHEIDPRAEIEAWLRKNALIRSTAYFQNEEHTLRGLREGIRHARKYRSFLYKIYLIEKEG